MRSLSLQNILTAGTFWPRFLGLMGMRNWPPGAKGLFFPHCRSVHTFFTFLKPDLVFMDKTRTILEIVPSAGPWRLFWGPPESEHCLELPRGSCGKLRLKVGMIVRF